MNAGFRVLIVDDEKMIRDAVSAFFIKKECEVFQADNGQDALRIFEKEDIQFIILDLMLPGMSGEEICRSIRSTSKVPIIMLTAKTQEDSILNGLQIGADDYVTKPFSVKELYARVEAVMSRISSDHAVHDSTVVFDGGLQLIFSMLRSGREILL